MLQLKDSAPLWSTETENGITIATYSQATFLAPTTQIGGKYQCFGRTINILGGNDAFKFLEKEYITSGIHKYLTLLRDTQIIADGCLVTAEAIIVIIIDIIAAILYMLHVIRCPKGRVRIK